MKAAALTMIILISGLVAPARASFAPRRVTVASQKLIAKIYLRAADTNQKKKK